MLHQQYSQSKQSSYRSVIKDITHKQHIEAKLRNPDKILTQDAVLNRRFQHMSEYYLDIVDPKTKKKVDKEYSWAFSVLEDGSETSIQVGIYNACWVLYNKYANVTAQGAVHGALAGAEHGVGGMLWGAAIGVGVALGADWVGGKVFDHYDKEDFPMNDFIKKNDLLNMNGIKKFNKSMEDHNKRLFSYRNKVKRYGSIYQLEYGPTWYDDPGLSLDYLNSNKLDYALSYKEVFKFFTKYLSIVNNAYGRRNDKAVFEAVLRETDHYVTVLAVALDEHLKFVFKHIKVV